MLSWVSAILAASLLLWSCEDNGFKATGGASVAAKPTPTPTPDPNAGSDPGKDGVKERDEENLNGIDDGDDCLATGVEDVNVVIVLDNSGSQKDTDPGMVRASASKEFVRKMAEAVKDGKVRRVSISVVSFNGNATTSSWVKIRDLDAASEVESDISNATSSPNGTTKYAPAFSQASSLFSQLGTRGDVAEDRNYVIFLTDGEPKDDSSAIHNAVESITNDYDAAIIAVASGSDVDEKGARTVENLARPLSNDDKPKHLGQFIRAVSSDDLKSAWESIFDRISTCS